VLNGVGELLGGIGAYLSNMGKGVIYEAAVVRVIQEKTYLHLKITKEELAFKEILLKMGHVEKDLKALGVNNFRDNFYFQDDLQQLATLVESRISLRKDLGGEEE